MNLPFIAERPKGASRRNCVAVVRALALLLALQRMAEAQPLDPGYPDRSVAQRDTAPRLIGRLVWPVLAAPALVRQGARLRILLLRPSGVAAGWPGAELGAWRVTLIRRAARANAEPLRWSCPVRKIAPGRSTVELQAEVPAELARDVYDLQLVGPAIDEQQPNAVRVLEGAPAETYRFAVVADHQLSDPTYRVGGRELNGGAYPRRDKEAANLAIARQGLAELSLLDPDFVLHLGDLGFGLDHQAEYAQGRELLVDARLPVFAVPGNHDGYAEYSVRLRGGAARLVGGALGCRRHLDGELGWGKAWAFVSCVHGDIKPLLYADLRRDGLQYWRRQLGPPAFSFEHGRLRFVGLNTFDGTPERRHAFSLYLDLFELRLGVPAVDNHGGYLRRDQLLFLRDEARRARRRGLGLVVFGHHDPRGNVDPPRYHANEPFPTDPLALGGFEEWNYDSPAWDSDPTDDRRAESPEQNSALELLSILAESGGTYLSGHIHRDGRQVYEPGSLLGPFRVQRRLEFIRTTSASSLVRGEKGYWGYRLIEVRGDRLEAIDYAPERELGSVPAGNLWLEPRDSAPHREILLRSGLPQPTRVVVSWELPARDEGYRFRWLALEGSSTTAASPRVLEVSLAGARAGYRLQVELPAAPHFPTPGAPPGRGLRALPARGNTGPVPRLEVTAVGRAPVPVASTFLARVGQPLLLSADRSTDPQGDRIIAHLWNLGEGRTARGSRLLHTFSGPGRRRVALTLVDEAGARNTLMVEAVVEPPVTPGCRGCCAATEDRGAITSGILPLLLFVLVSWPMKAAERRRRR